MEILYCLPDSYAVESRGIRRMTLGQYRGNLLHQPAAHHFLRSVRDASMEHRPGNSQDNVPRVQRAPGTRCLLPIGKWPSAEQRHLDGSGGTLSPSAVEAPIQTTGPAEQLQ